jgi:hypothetical protein
MESLHRNIFASLAWLVVLPLGCEPSSPGDTNPSSAPSELIGRAKQAQVATAPLDGGLTATIAQCYWGTSDGTAGDQQCVAGELGAATAGGGQVCVIGTHGCPSGIQCMPPPGVYTGSGAAQLLCSICYAGASTADDPSVAQCLAAQQGAACNNVIACTGPVTPAGASTTPNGNPCAQMNCDGIWVDGCNPPNPINPFTPGICYTTTVTQPASNPLPGAATVGCFAGDTPATIWQRCRNVYNSWVVATGTFSNTTCADIWANPPDNGLNDPTLQQCQDLVNSCVRNTQASCPPAPAPAPAPAPVPAPTPTAVSAQ